MNKLLKDGADVDFVGKYGWTALHHAAHSGFEDTARDLLAAGADVNARSEHFGTPLALAAVKGRCNVATTLLKSRASVRTPCGRLGSVIHSACAGGNIELIKAVIDHGADLTKKEKFDVTIIDMLRESRDVGNYLDFEYALEAESEYSRESTPDSEMEGTVYLHYDTDLLDKRQCTSAINVAALYGNCDALVFVLRHVVDNPNEEVYDALNYTSAFGQPETLLALELNFVDLIRLDHRHGSLAVIAAAYTGNYACLKHLLEKGASAGPIGEGEMTALLWAARKGHTECVNLLTDSDHLDENWINLDPQGATPLMDAAHYGHLECVRLLLRKGASIEPPDGSGRNALHCAAEDGHVVIIEELVKAGIDVNSLDDYGWTPLTCSLYQQEWCIGEVFKPRQYLVQKLIALGADPTINNIAQKMEDRGRKDALPWLEKKEIGANDK